MQTQEFTTVIKPKNKLLELNLIEIFHYRDLIFMFVKRNFKSQYKQTILGPLWFIINPLITSVLFTVVFGGIANISTDGVPQFLFYMAGNTAWQYFATCLTSTSSTFTANAGIFGKVYFPRLTMPISTVIYSVLSFIIQFVMMLGFMIYFVAIGESVNPNIYALLLPVFVIHMAAMGLGFGIIISSLTTKYRDLAILVGFGVQLWMYITPVVYPLSTLSDKAKSLVMLNPMAPVVNNFRYAFLGCGQMEWGYWALSGVITLIVLLVGIIIFNKVEKTFMDTV
jgi:lipopolysaccharide transport system permease protein